MLHIIHDSDKTNWLRYILDEFKRINIAKFDIDINHISQNIHTEEPTIYYTESYFAGVCIPNCSSITPVGETEDINSKIFILKGSSVDDSRFDVRYDVFWNSFVFLSRLEEFKTEDGGKTINSNSFNHPRIDKSTFEIPIVNYLFNSLEELIKAKFPELQFGSKQKPNIELSHDVDYISKTWQLQLKQTAFNFFNITRTINNPNRALKNTKKTFAFLFSRPSYWCFEFWEEIEKKTNRRSVYYIFAKSAPLNMKSRLLDPSYDIRDDTKLQFKLKQLIDDGFEIGLHGSYFSAVDGNKLQKEKQLLEETVKSGVTKIRQHWLKYDEKITPYLHNQLFKYDSTLGWNDRMGFRSGIASRYRPYDHKAQKSFKYFITPQVIMDSHLFDYGQNRVDYQMHKAFSILDELDKNKSSFISLSWHQRSASKDYGWHYSYEELLKKVSMN